MNKQNFYMAVMALAAVEVGVIATHAQALAGAPAWFWLLAGPAALRAARTISFNAIGAPIRQRWTVVEPDGSGAGDTVNPAKMKDGQDHPLGELLACPICTGTHAAAALLALYGLLPAAGLALVALLGVAGISEGLNWLYCLIEWKGHTAREDAGRMVRTRERAKTRAEIEQELARKIARDAETTWRLVEREALFGEAWQGWQAVTKQNGGEE